jgi:archaellum component FlaC
MMLEETGFEEESSIMMDSSAEEGMTELWQALGDVRATIADEEKTIAKHDEALGLMETALQSLMQQVRNLQDDLKVLRAETVQETVIVATAAAEEAVNSNNTATTNQEFTWPLCKSTNMPCKLCKPGVYCRNHRHNNN